MSDLDGLVYKKIGDSVDEQGISIIRELKAAGYSVRLQAKSISQYFSNITLSGTTPNVGEACTLTVRNFQPDTHPHRVRFPKP